MVAKSVFLASDHAGFSVKSKVIDKLAQLGVPVEDLGPDSDARVDYPDYANLVAEKIKVIDGAFGVLVCGSGQGMAMRANKYPWVRAALCWNDESAQLARAHNNANILCVGSRLLTEETLLSLIEVFFKTEFEGGRHQARIEKINQAVE